MQSLSIRYSSTLPLWHRGRHVTVVAHDNSFRYKLRITIWPFIGINGLFLRKRVQLFSSPQIEYKFP